MPFALTQFALPPLAEVLARDSGLHEASIRIVLIVLLIAVLIPVAGFLARGVDRLLFASRLALEQRIGRMVQQLSQCEGPQALGERRRGRGSSRRSIRAAAYSIRAATTCSRRRWLLDRCDAAFLLPRQPARGSPARAARAAGAGDVDAKGFASLSSFQRAVLETLGAEVVVPVRRAGQLVAFVCLGGKRSGDVYTEQDRALLASIVEKASNELVRFHELELARAGAMNARLRRYVPGAMAEQLERGGSLARGEREVSVLFVDVRGYPASPSRHARADLRAVSAYTERSRRGAAMAAPWSSSTATA